MIALKSQEPIRSFLKKQQIKVQSFSQESENDKINGLALFIGQHYNKIAHILSSIKEGIKNKKSIQCDMSEQIPLKEVITFSRTFCNLLRELKFLKSYQYTKKIHCCYSVIITTHEYTAIS